MIFVFLDFNTCWKTAGYYRVSWIYQALICKWKAAACRRHG